MNGGLSPEMVREGPQLRNKLLAIQRPCVIPDHGLLCDLLWSDPTLPPSESDPENDPFANNPPFDLDGFIPNVENENGLSLCFSSDAVHTFLRKEGLCLMVRSKQVVEDGYEFFASRKLVTIFSAANFRGEFDNAGCILGINRQLKCSV